MEDASHQVWAWLTSWQRTFRVSHLAGRLEPISPLQVTGENGLPGAELVGVVIETGSFTILHTRVLLEDDVIHELLHVAFPAWAHEAVEAWTEVLSRDRDQAVQLLSTPPSMSLRRRTMAATGEYKAFNLRTRQQCTIKDPEVVTMKNGRMAVRGVASDDGKTRVFRILSYEEARVLEAKRG
jgi:hypothetical protein